MAVMDELIDDLQIQIAKADNFPKFIKGIDSFNKKALPIFVESGLTGSYAAAFLLKISNSLVGKYQYINRHEQLIYAPYSLFVDPSNKCPLHCPGCLHNRVFQDKIIPDWPNGLLQESVYTSFIERFGPYASSILFFNWGEPLLNPKTPKFIRQAKSFLLHTSLSSNLSINFDAESLVQSGLDYMILSVDGATPKTYKQYRQGGNFNLVIKNIKRIVAAREKLRVSTPWLCWQFLLFEHNKHEQGDAKAMAQELGVDAIKFSTPYDVIWRPDLQLAQNCPANKYTFKRKCKSYGKIETMLAPSFAKILRQKWEDKLNRSVASQMSEKRTGKTCEWLYSTIVMDALGRYLPCCYVPRKKAGFTYIFGDTGSYATGERNGSPFNSEYYRFSRNHFVWLSELETAGGQAPTLEDNKHATYCVACPNKDLPPLINNNDLNRYLKVMDTTNILSNLNMQIISNWKF